MSISDQHFADPTVMRAARDIAARIWNNTPGIQKILQRTQSAMVSGMVHRQREVFNRATGNRILGYDQVRGSALPAHSRGDLARSFDTPQMRAVQQRVSCTITGSLPSTNTLLGLEWTREIYDRVIQLRGDESEWWMPDDIDPFAPARVTGLDDKLADYRRVRAIEVHVDYVKAILHHSHRRSAEPPGRFLTARGHLTRGPNTGWSTPIPCRPAGLVHA
ncbi:hypothetical protein [Nocardia brasiliensis]|uniref:hypothetical protein n=1 Tax=Nocardia brasiliensis TaxID=37326 RepID=UPI0024549BCA|nr:hypothetical protein [Nocardia brasiliensis]